MASTPPRIRKIPSHPHNGTVNQGKEEPAVAAAFLYFCSCDKDVRALNLMEKDGRLSQGSLFLENDCLTSTCLLTVTKEFRCQICTSILRTCCMMEKELTEPTIKEAFGKCVHQGASRYSQSIFSFP